MLPVAALEQLCEMRAEAIPSSSAAVVHGGTETAIRGLIGLYFFLLIFEGALRKWVMPGMSSPLLVIRDPVVLLIYLLAIPGGMFPRNNFMTTMFGLAAMAMFFGFLADQFDPAVYLFGLRTNFLHLPLIFVMARVMTYAHVVRLGWWILLLSIPMTYLVVLQFQAGAGDVLNIGAGGTGMQMETSGGKLRASGTFSFVAGVVCFYAIVAGFLLNSLMRPGTYPRWLQLIALVSLVAAVATSGSRAALAGVIMVAATIVLVVMANPALLGRVALTVALISVVTFVVLQFAFVEEGAEILSLRFGEAGGAGGIWPRLIDTFAGPFRGLGAAPLFGRGLGMGTNAAAAMVTSGGQAFFGEGEWSRLIEESGPVFGLLFIAWRCALVFFLFRTSLNAARGNNLLPILLFGASAMFILNGQFGQPTILGFAALGGGLCLAAANTGTDNESLIVESDQNAPPTVPKRRGRSAYAERLHGDKSNVKV
ncbi:MAG: hypothetical protein H7062_23085 [Candidatus Saccharimonas sp.]|nr:hypothetical protein [Planctomycetaceae bacterium]